MQCTDSLRVTLRTGWTIRVGSPAWRAGLQRRPLTFSEYFRGGDPSRAIGTFAGKHWAISLPRDGTPVASSSPFLLRRVRHGVVDGVDMMRPVSHSPCSLAFTFILYHSSCARRACCCSTRLASPLAYFFISPENFLSLPFPPPPMVHCTVFYIDWRWFWNRTSDRDDPSCLEEGEVRPWCARRSCSLRSGNVR
jgi:hypothetical protein